MSGSDGRAIVSWRPGNDPVVRLFCIAHAGGGAAPFRSWAAQLPEGIGIAAARLPGRESRFSEPAHEDLEPLVAELAAAVDAEVPPPFAIFGDCFGAIVAFELARELQRRGARPPEHLIVADQPAPHARPRSGPDPAAAALPLPERAALLGGTDPRILENETVFGIVAPALAADLAIADDYRFVPGPRLEVPISVIANPAAIDEPAAYEAWGELTTAACTVTFTVSVEDSFFSEAGWAALGSFVAERLLPSTHAKRDRSA